MIYEVARSALTPLARAYYRPVVEGTEHVPRTGAVILASNHLAAVDSVAIPLAAPRRVAFLAKAEYFHGGGLKTRLTGWGLRTLGAVPVRRGANRSALASLDEALGVLAAGDAFGIYPEGTRSLDGRLHRGRTGVAWLALTADVPVVPVAVAGTERILPPGARLPRRCPVTVRFGAPLTFPRWRGMATSARARRAVTDEIMDAIGELSGQVRAPHYHELPTGDR
ncbi:lysophospholipid acyltransferase family protein [Micromonospora sp. NPDC049559]|uniref:lysophospholipid acyltransferase family protein n=1 Tax=Micromonospora sp. NPDC049559 TaxID=3155923 RepID=UPI00343A604E